MIPKTRGYAGDNFTFVANPTGYDAMWGRSGLGGRRGNRTPYLKRISKGKRTQMEPIKIVLLFRDENAMMKFMIFG